MSYLENPPRRNILPHETRIHEVEQKRWRLSLDKDNPGHKNGVGRPMKKSMLAMVYALMHLGKI